MAAISKDYLVIGKSDIQRTIREAGAELGDNLVDILGDISASTKFFWECESSEEVVMDIMNKLVEQTRQITLDIILQHAIQKACE